MKSIIGQCVILIRKYNGLTYDMLFILYSWIYGLVFRRLVVSESAVRFFERGDAGLKFELFALLAAAALSEIIGGFFIIQRIRHVKTRPDDYPGIISGTDNYIPGDGMFFFQLWLAGCRLALSAYMGYIAFTALGLGKLSAIGCFVFILKDGILAWVFVRSVKKPLTIKPPAVFRYAANVLLGFSGMVCASAGFEAFMARSRDVLCNFHHWTGFGNFLLSLLLYLLFFAILFIPTRAVYYIEEIEFVDSREDARALRRSFLVTVAFSIIPWLF